MKKAGLGMIMLALAALAVVAALAAAPLYVHGRLTHEAPIAELYFTPERPGVWRAHVSTGPRCGFAEYELFGEEWRLDAAFVKWTHRATLLGLDPLYRIERISGRYASVEDENSRPHRAHSLAPKVLIDPFRVTEDHWLVDTIYGSSAYDRIDPAKRYLVLHSGSGIFVRALDGAKSGALRPCDDSPGWLERMSRRLNEAFERFESSESS